MLPHDIGGKTNASALAIDKWEKLQCDARNAIKGIQRIRLFLTTISDGQVSTVSLNCRRNYFCRQHKQMSIRVKLYTMLHAKPYSSLLYSLLSKRKEYGFIGTKYCRQLRDAYFPF